MPTSAKALTARAASFPHDRSLAPADVPAEQLDSALLSAEAASYARLDQLEAVARAQSERQLSREQAKLSAYFDYRDLAARDRLESSRRILADLEASDSSERRRIIPGVAGQRGSRRAAHRRAGR